MIPPPFGTCVCGYSTWVLTDGKALHPCCAVAGSDCEPCKISRDLNARWRSRQARNPR